MSGNNEDYLKAILELGGDEETVSNKEISEHLDISKPSVSEMLRKLDDKGYAKYSPYKGVILTKTGIEKAYELRKRHFLWEVFLVEKLGYKWDEVHIEAEKLEHLTDEKLEKRLDEFLGSPKFCPHGRRILRNEEQEPKYRKIYELLIDEEATIKRVEDKKEVLNYLDSINLKINDKIIIKNNQKDNLIIKLEKNNKNINFKKEYIESIYVK